MVSNVRAASLIRGAALAAFLLGAAACRGRPPMNNPDKVTFLVDSLRPAVERATGGSSRRANLALLERNAALAAEVAVALSVPP